MNSRLTYTVKFKRPFIWLHVNRLKLWETTFYYINFLNVRIKIKYKRKPNEQT